MSCALRAGRSAWRCVYERISDIFVVGAVGPEAQMDKAGFDGAVSAAKARLGEIESRRMSAAITSLVY